MNEHLPTNTRPIRRIITAHQQQEGGGFVVRRPFPTRGFSQADPFLMLDEMGPITYAPGQAVGAPDHPHRGFETVSYILEGEVEHEDSAGHKGKLGAGDVQWMTAGRGIVHSEMPSKNMQRNGGRVHGFQIWVNLPAKDKMMEPRYQEIPRHKIPEATTADGRANVRVVAGEALGVSAVIETRTPIGYHHWRLQPGASVTLPLPRDHAAYVYVFRGSMQVCGQVLNAGQLAVLGEGETVQLDAQQDGEALLLHGAPLREPVVQYGPFVMNSEAEIRTAIMDFQLGKMGAIQRS